MSPATTDVVLVTGASRGIGRGIAVELARRGMIPAIHYHTNESAARRTAALALEELNRSGVALEALPVFRADIGSAQEREKLYTHVVDAFGHIDGLVNNAGIAPPRRDDILVAGEDSFDTVLAVNLAADGRVL